MHLRHMYKLRSLAYIILNTVCDLSNAVDLEPKNYKAYYMRACAYLNLKEWEKAKNDFVTVEFLCPNFGVTRIALKQINDVGCK